MIRNFPKGMHPMTQLSSAILALQTDSVFAREYAKGTNKALYWDHSYEDMMNLIARLPEVAAIIYRCTYYDGVVKPYDNTLDYSANFAQMLGYDDPSFHELMRLYIVIHSDHEGGNASAHTCHLVGSTLSDPYLSLCASMNALAGPLHGLANQEVLAPQRQKTLDQGKPVRRRRSKPSPARRAPPARPPARPNDHRVQVGVAQGGQGEQRPGLRPRGAAQDRPAVHLAARVCAQAHARRRALQAGEHRVRGDARRAHRARQDEEPVPQRRLALGRAAQVLRPRAVRLLHRALRRRPGTARSKLPLERPKSVTSDWLTKFFKDNPDGLK